MAIKITDECINCGACEPECPNNAIYEGGGMGDSRRHNSKRKLYPMDGFYRRDQRNAPSVVDTYYIVLQ